MNVGLVVGGQCFEYCHILKGPASTGWRYPKYSMATGVPSRQGELLKARGLSMRLAAPDAPAEQAQLTLCTFAVLHGIENV